MCTCFTYMCIYTYTYSVIYTVINIYQLKFDSDQLALLNL